MTQISSAVAGSMILNGAAPKGLHVKGYLYLRDCTRLTSLPEDLHVAGDLDLRGCTGLTSLPEGLHVEGHLYLRGCTGLTSLPEDLHVAGDIYLSGCTGLTSLPEGLHVTGDLYLGGCIGLRAIPRTAAQRSMLKRVADAVQAPGNRLGMGRWHTCETTHCIAGWVAYLAGVERGEAPSIAGYRLLGAEAATHFYDDDEDAMAWLLEAVARDEAEDSQ